MKKFKTNKASTKSFHRVMLLILSAITILWSPRLVSAQDTANLTFNIDNKTLTEALEIVQQQSGFSFFYYDGLINPNLKVTLKEKGISLRQALDRILANTGNGYSIDGKQVFICKKGNENKRMQASDKPTISVSGRVSETNGKPMIGASVIVSGTNTGVISDSQGNFHIPNVPVGSTINISYVGYTPISIIAKDGNPLNIVLQADLQSVDEVVVIGYGTQRRSMVTNAISKMQMDDSKLRQVNSPSQLLNGRIAGVSTSTSSGNLGSGERLTIRGSSSLSASNEPLYVIDGIPITNTSANILDFGEPMSSLSVLSLSDIESIEILKDAASAAIYGSRGTNGVVVITTKSGKEGKSDARVNYSVGISRFPSVDRIKMVDSKQYIEQYNNGIDNYNKQYGLQVGDTGFKTYITNPFGDSPDTDWMDAILQTGSFHNIDASFSGGSKKTNYYIGANYSNQKGVIKTNKLDKMNFKVKVNHKFTNWLEVGSNMSGNYMKNYQVPGADLGTTIIARGIQQRPFDRPYKPNGDYYLGGTDEMAYHNPLQILNEENCYFENMRYLGNIYANIKIKDKVSLRSSFNADVTQIYDYTFYNEKHPYGTGVGRIVDQNRTVLNLLVENFANYDDKFGNLSLNFMLGHSFQKVTTRSSMIDGRGFPSPSFDVVGVASEIYDASGSLSDYAMESYFGRINLALKDRYILNASLRTDGSSKFAPDNRWGWFPSVSLGWNISKEAFMEHSNTELKIRASYGQTGNQEGIGSYAYQALMSGGKNYGNQSGIAVTTFGNKDLTWEKTAQYDVGFDLAILKGRLNIIGDFYYKKTTDLLYSMPVHATTGVTSISSNIGSMRNIGAELTLNTHFIFGKVEWLSQLNIATNRNKITSLLDDANPISIGGNRALQVGKPMGAFYLFEQEGIFQYDGEVPSPQYATGIRAGDVKWKDVDNNGLINDTDRQVMGCSTPDFFGGWNNTFRYKGIQLDFLFSYMYGNDVYAQWMINLSRLSHKTPPMELQAINRWTGPGSTNKYPRAMNGDSNNVRNSDRWLKDGSFIRLRTLTLAYNFPTKILSKWHMKGLRVFFQGDNLFILSEYPGWDPEVSNSMDPRFFGVDLFSVPQPRTYTLGVNVTF